MATYVVDLPAKFAGIKVGPTVLLRDPDDEIEIILLCDNHPFQIVLTDELDAKKPRQSAGGPTGGEERGMDRTRGSGA